MAQNLNGGNYEMKNDQTTIKKLINQNEILEIFIEFESVLATILPIFAYFQSAAILMKYPSN